MSCTWHLSRPEKAKSHSSPRLHPWSEPEALKLPVALEAPFTGQIWHIF